MEEKASLSTVSACVLGSGKGKDKMWGEREERVSWGREREKGFASFYRVCGFKRGMIKQ
jgi:hypothetical protein